MTITAVIAEYNPFHNGHAYQLAKARELTGADYLVVIMSGDFVQRGAPAILDQHDRAELALLGGADLILQLPCHFALGSAQHFARGAVSLLTALGCVDFLCFGSEYGDTAPFLELADVLLHEPEEYRELLSGLLRNGLSFPTARAQALSAYFSDSASFSSLSKEELLSVSSPEAQIFPSDDGVIISYDNERKVVQSKELSLADSIVYMTKIVCSSPSILQSTA